MTAARCLAILGLLGLGIGCSEEAPAPVMSESVVATAPSDSDMCADHGVLEALCTKCHPKLIPVFESRGDWCPEHGFPESICPVCSPDAKGRPKVDVSPSDGSPPDGVVVDIASAEAADRAGLVTVAAVTKELAETIEVPLEIAFDASRVAEIRAPRPGIVSEVFVNIGSSITMGMPLVKLSSPELTIDRSKVAGARALESAHQRELRRLERLLKDQLITREQVAAARAQWIASRAEADALDAGLNALGETNGAFFVNAPIAGEIQTRDVVSGAAITPEERLFTVVDARVVWALLAVPELSIGRVAVGQSVEIRVDALPEVVLQGKVDWIAPSLDPHSRTTQVRVPLDNASGALRAGMYGDARISVSAKATRVFVPRRAVQRAKSAALVFVPKGNAAFVGERVTLGMTVGDDVELTSGLSAGARVVTDGAFFLKTETLKDSIGAGCCANDE